MILYPFPDSVLSFDDYKPIPDLSRLNITDKIGLIDNLYSVIGNAFVNHSELLLTELYNDIITVKTDVFQTLVKSFSAGHIALVIGSTKYIDIDTATEKALSFIQDADPEQIEQLQVSDIDSVIRNCFSGSLKAGQY